MTFRVRWAVYAVLALLPAVGALAGAFVVSGKPPVHGAESRLALGRADQLDAGVQQLAANYARFLTPEMALAGLPVPIAAQVSQVSASPIPDSNVIRVEAKAASSEAAVEAARTATRVLQAKVTALSGAPKAKATLARYTTLSRAVAGAQSRVNASGGSGPDYVSAATDLASLQAQQQAVGELYRTQAAGAANSALTLLRPAVATGDNVTTRRQLHLLGGFGAGALLAYVISRLLPAPRPRAARVGRTELRADLDPHQPAGSDGLLPAAAPVLPAVAPPAVAPPAVAPPAVAPPAATRAPTRTVDVTPAVTPSALPVTPVRAPGPAARPARRGRETWTEDTSPQPVLNLSEESSDPTLPPYILPPRVAPPRSASTPRAADGRVRQGLRGLDPDRAERLEW